MPSGRMIHLPFAGGAWEQDELLLMLIGHARRAWEVFGFKPKNKMKWTPEDRDYIAWVNDGE